MVPEQGVNLNKFDASFSACVPVELKGILCMELRVREAKDDWTYLGFLIHVGNKNKAIFEYIRDHLW